MTLIEAISKNRYPLLLGLVPIILYLIKNGKDWRNFYKISLDKVSNLYLNGIEIIGGYFAFNYAIFNTVESAPNTYIALGGVALTWIGIKGIFSIFFSEEYKLI